MSIIFGGIECGRPAIGFPRIVNGVEARPKQWPWQISMRLGVGTYVGVPLLRRDGSSLQHIACRLIFNLIWPRELRQLIPLPCYDFKNPCINLYHIMHVHFTRCLTHIILFNIHLF